MTTWATQMIMLSKTFAVNKAEHRQIMCAMEPSHSTLFVSVATVALMLLADNKVIFSLATPRNDARGWWMEGFWRQTY